MLDYLKNKNKKVLIILDEVDNSLEMKYFIQGYVYCYQVLGYLLYKNKKTNVEEKILSDLD